MPSIQVEMELAKKRNVRASSDRVSVWLLMPSVQNDISKHQNSLVLPSTFRSPCTGPHGERPAWIHKADGQKGIPAACCCPGSCSESSQRSLSYFRIGTFSLAAGATTVEMRDVRSREVKWLVQGQHSKSVTLRLAFLLGLGPVFFLLRLQFIDRRLLLLPPLWHPIAISLSYICRPHNGPHLRENPLWCGEWFPFLLLFGAMFYRFVSALSFELLEEGCLVVVGHPGRTGRAGHVVSPHGLAVR